MNLRWPLFSLSNSAGTPVKKFSTNSQCIFSSVVFYQDNFENILLL